MSARHSRPTRARPPDHRPLSRGVSGLCQRSRPCAGRPGVVPAAGLGRRHRPACPRAGWQVTRSTAAIPSCVSPWRIVASGTCWRSPAATTSARTSARSALMTPPGRFTRERTRFRPAEVTTPTLHQTRRISRRLAEIAAQRIKSLRAGPEWPVLSVLRVADGCHLRHVSAHQPRLSCQDDCQTRCHLQLIASCSPMGRSRVLRALPAMSRGAWAGAGQALVRPRLGTSLDGRPAAGRPATAARATPNGPVARVSRAHRHRAHLYTSVHE